jgi:hypothetical protein
MAVLPSGVLVALVGLFVNFWCLKFMLLRRWKPMSKLSSQMAYLVMKYTHLAVVMHVYFTRAMFASWPFDSACSHQPSAALNETDTTPVWTYCNKDMFVPVYWMERMPWQSDDQFATVNMFNFLLIFLLGGLACTGAIISTDTIHGFFFSKRSNSEGSPIMYSEVEGVESYIPMLHQRALLYPVIAANWYGGYCIIILVYTHAANSAPFCGRMLSSVPIFLHTCCRQQCVVLLKSRPSLGTRSRCCTNISNKK